MTNRAISTAVRLGLFLLTAGATANAAEVKVIQMGLAPGGAARSKGGLVLTG